MQFMFKDRIDAANQLAEQLTKYKSKDGVVLAIPRGGVPIGYIIAKKLNMPLEIFLSKKIGHPNNPEYAIGSVSLSGVIENGSLDEVTEEYIQRESERILKNLKEKYALYMGTKKSASLTNKTVIIVDDGIATGSTIKAAIQSVKKSSPKEIIVAVPVAPQEIATKFSRVVDDFICIIRPSIFHAVGSFFKDFSQVSDDDVMSYLNRKLDGTHIKL